MEMKGFQSEDSYSNHNPFFALSWASHWLSWCSGLLICKMLLTVTSFLLTRVLWDENGWSYVEWAGEWDTTVHGDSSIHLLDAGATLVGTVNIVESSLAAPRPRPLPPSRGMKVRLRCSWASGLGRLLPSGNGFVLPGSHLLPSYHWSDTNGSLIK